MRFACALLGLVAVMSIACGRYGPPVRTRPAPKAGATAAANAQSPAAANAESPETDDEEHTK
jgi:hypothetical protein